MDHMERNTLIVYGHDYCWQSQLLKKTLLDHRIEYEWRDVMAGDPRYQTDLKKVARGNLSVPTVIFPDGTVMVEPMPSQVLHRLKPRQPNLVERWLGWTRLV
ncbi:MAG: hypothetical protein L0Y55_00610 [Anaerolineales bacterium]|nr:hypothetical protein [Anaerolineales bacterium]